MIRITDGSAKFAKYHISGDIPERFPFHTDKEGAYIYDDRELERARAMLGDAKYTVAEIAHDAGHIEKARGQRYLSRSEAIAHFQHDIEPEHGLREKHKKALATIADLSSRLERMESTVTQHAKEFAALKKGG
ncbi:MAG: hypothetical protein M0P69_03215 [Bacteroidales bacterium]|nr:hypothetical protein [Bacteroidales bacterium]